MWSNNTADAKIDWDQINIFKIFLLNGHENIDPNICFKFKTGKMTRGHEFTLMKGQSRFFLFLLFESLLPPFRNLGIFVLFTTLQSTQL